MLTRGEALILNVEVIFGLFSEGITYLRGGANSRFYHLTENISFFKLILGR